MDRSTVTAVSPWGPSVAEDDGLARIELVIVSIRLAIVLSAIVMLAFGTGAVRSHLPAAAGLLCVAFGYAVLLMFHPSWERPGIRATWAVTLVDSALALGVVAATGGAESLAATILLLVVVGAATRMRLPATIAASVAIGSCYLALVLVVEPEVGTFHERLQTGVWWAVYLVFTAVFAGSLALYAERAHEAQAAARAEAIAEHAAAEEERDLRSRLLAAQQARHDGLRAILHDFRTPVSSLRALTSELTSPDAAVAEQERMTALRLVGAHAEHLSAMLDALSDVAASRNPALPAGTARVVELRELLLAAGDAAGLRPPQLRLTVVPQRAELRLDTQRLRRVLTNLLDNAARHGRGKPVDVIAGLSGGELGIEILDRGPGLTPEQLRVVTRKDVSLGGSAGGSGLGLWIVEQILEAMRGELRLALRDGGGLAARLRLPLD